MSRPSERGVSLIEATIVMAVFAVLSAAMAPAIQGYVDRSRQTRARTDVQAIAQALQDWVADTGESQFLINGSNGALDRDPPSRGDANRVNLLVGDGDIPVLAAAIAAETFWAQGVNSTTVDTFSNHLIENLPAEASTSRYRNPSDMLVLTPGGNQADFARSSSSGFNAPYAWRGGYLRGPVDPDPWGNRYAANVAFLDPAATAAISGITPGFTFGDYARLDVFVMSAGPDEEVDTRAAQDGAVPFDDDFIFVVSANAK
jgi:type II secretory pathway pseudopilin PulG